MATLSGGHLTADLCQGALPALLPFLISHRGYSYGAASALVLAATVSSSVIQPLFGHLSDRHSMPWLMPVGLLLGGVGIGLVGVMPSYPLTFAVIVVSGLGVAAFHPEASRFANYVSGARRATGMSFFSVGGNLGFALGPAVVTPLVLILGLHGTPLVALVPGAMALVVASQLPHLVSFRPTPAAARTGPEASTPDAWGPFARLAAVVAARSVLYFGLMTFVPLYFVHDLHASKGAAGAVLTMMLLGGAAGTLVGGPAADRYGRRHVLLVSMALVAPLVAIMLALSPVGAAALLVLIGATTVATFSVTVVMGQEYLPSRIGIASGVTLGL
ncbi:MAG: major facilitator superfamily 1, partial [Solirubrobacterales bacterium]|nr:major facilitator superfamily 1 [Solirubrobacterales bacterium]